MSAAVPIRANLAIAVAALAANIALLWAASHAGTWWGVALAAVGFSFTNNTVFSLQHEAVHRCFHSNMRINEGAGMLFAAFFPTIFQIQRISHFGHQQSSKTDTFVLQNLILNFIMESNRQHGG